MSNVYYTVQTEPAHKYGVCLWPEAGGEEWVSTTITVIMIPG